MPDDLQLARLLGLAAMMRAAYEAESQMTKADPEPTGDEVLRVQRFLSFPAEAQEKALAYLENLQKYLKEGE
jgi:hypothetical protein